MTVAGGVALAVTGADTEDGDAAVGTALDTDLILTTFAGECNDATFAGECNDADLGKLSSALGLGQ